MAKIGKKRELKSEIIAFRVTASFKAALETEAAKDKRECVPASISVGQ